MFTKFVSGIKSMIIWIGGVLMFGATLHIMNSASDYLASAESRNRQEVFLLRKKGELVDEKVIELVKRRAPVIKGPDSPDPIPQEKSFKELQAEFWGSEKGGEVLREHYGLPKGGMPKGGFERPQPRN